MTLDSRSPQQMRVISHRELDVYCRAVDVAMKEFHASKSFPKEEVCSLTSQIRRCSRSVAANIAEAWRKRRYQAAFVSKLSDAEAEAAETQTHVELASRCNFISSELAGQIDEAYEHIIRTLVGMIHHADRWTIPKP